MPASERLSHFSESGPKPEPRVIVVDKQGQYLKDAAARELTSRKSPGERAQSARRAAEPVPRRGSRPGSFVDSTGSSCAPPGLGDAPPLPRAGWAEKSLEELSMEELPSCLRSAPGGWEGGGGSPRPRAKSARQVQADLVERKATQKCPGCSILLAPGELYEHDRKTNCLMKHMLKDGGFLASSTCN
eukprot:897839-Prorocentrum_minimum.AAC.1